MNTQAIGKEQRESSIELFRILTMLLIVAHHYVVNSGLATSICADPLSWRSLFLLLFGAWGKTGINCFVLISGYFMCKSHITAKKFFKLLGEVMFYRLVISAIFWATSYAPFSLKTLLLRTIPVTNIADGFTNAYLVFFLAIPFLNVLVQHLNERQHLRLILLCAFVYIFLGTVPVFSVVMNYVSWFIVLYFLASYIRLYPKKLFDNTKFWGWTALAMLVISALSVICMTWLGARPSRNSIAVYYYFLSDSNKILAVATALCAFMFFKNVKLRYSKCINTIAASTFGVFLIHTNTDNMRQWLWQDTLNNVGMYNSALMPLHAVGSVAGVFVICAFIDYLRIRFIETPFFRLWDKYWDGFLTWFQNTENKICKKTHIE